MKRSKELKIGSKMHLKIISRMTKKRRMMMTMEVDYVMIKMRRIAKIIEKVI